MKYAQADKRVFILLYEPARARLAGAKGGPVAASVAPLLELKHTLMSEALRRSMIKLLRGYSGGFIIQQERS